MTTAATQPPERRFSIAHLALLVPWVALVIDAWDPIGDNSFLWHVRAGTVQIEQGAVLTSDPFSFTMLGETWLTQSWLVEVLYGWAEGLTELVFVPFMILIVSTLTFVAVGLLAFRRAKSVPATAFVLILTTLALIAFLVPRPVIFSYLAMALVMLAWDRPSTRWALPFLFWLWAAVHASFLIGLAYVGLSLIMDREWKRLPTAIVSGLATLATAHGMGVVTFLVDFGQNNAALEYLTEWRRPELTEPVFLPFLGGIVFIVIGAFRHRIYPRHLWLIVPFVLLGMTSVRAIPPAWLALSPLVAQSLFGLEIGSRAGLRPRLAVIFTVVVLLLPFFLMKDAKLSEQRLPLEAAGHLEDVRTFHDDRVGGYLIWEQGPERLVYLDDRAELYGDRMREFFEIRTERIPWEPVFERDEIAQVLLANTEPLLPTLTESGWAPVYEDEWFTVLRPES